MVQSSLGGPVLVLPRSARTRRSDLSSPATAGHVPRLAERCGSTDHREREEQRKG